MFLTFCLSRTDVGIFVTQSGETKDTIEVMNMFKAAGALTFGIVNVVGSSISRETDCGMHIRAGSEISVASTKAFTAQALSVVMLAMFISQEKKTMLVRDILFQPSHKSVNAWALTFISPLNFISG